MEKGSFDSELGLPRPGDDPESSGSDKDKIKKKKQKSDTTKSEAPAKGKDTDTAPAKTTEKEEPKPTIPESFGALLERMTRDLRPEEKEPKESGLAKLLKGETEAETLRKGAAETNEEAEAGETPHEEKEPALEHLSTEERREAAEVYIDDRQRDVAEEIETSDPASTQSESARAVEEFLEATREKLKTPDRTVDDAAAESFEEVAQKYAPEVAVAAPPADEYVIEEIDQSDVEHAMEYEDFISPVADLPPVAAEGDTDDLPLTTEGDTPEAWGAAYQLYDDPLRMRNELMPEPAEAMLVQPPYPAERERSSGVSEVPSIPVGTALIVGFAAYLFGRRRGRIKTEKRLLPIQKSLEREVRDIHEKLAVHETQLRRLVQQQAEIRPLHVSALAANRSVEQLPAAEAATVAAIERPASLPLSAHQAQFELHTAATTIERSVAKATIPEQSHRPNESQPQPEPYRPALESPPAAPMPHPERNMPLQAGESFTPPPLSLYQDRPAEQSGSFMSYASETSPFETNKPETARLPAEVAMMPRAEVVKAADEIVVGAATMRQVFETNLISERGLRRIVAEYRRGGDVRAILAEELMIKEMGYERDPRVRDRPLAQQQAPHVITREVKEQNAPSAPAAPATPVPPLATMPPVTPPPLPPSLQPLPTQPSISAPKPGVLIVANVVAVGVLILLLVVLFILHL